MSVIDMSTERLETLRRAIRAAGKQETKQLLIDVFSDGEVRESVLVGGAAHAPINYMVRAADLARNSPAARTSERPALYCAALLVPIGEVFARSDRVHLPADCRLESREHLRLVLRRPIARLEACSGYDAELLRIAIGLGDDELWGLHEAARLKTIVTVALAKSKLASTMTVKTCHAEKPADA